jgi:hypothetical protein
MTEAAARKPRPRRTFSAFGDVRAMPSEYEIVTHQQNWTLRQNRTSALEQNPSSPANLWFLTYRDQSPLQADDWDSYRDPDALTYRGYVTAQARAQATLEGALEAYASGGADAALSAGSAALLARLFTPSRYLCHGMQQVEAYLGYIAPSSYITKRPVLDRRPAAPGQRHCLPHPRAAAQPAGIGRRHDGAGVLAGRPGLAARPQGHRVRPVQLRLG